MPTPSATFSTLQVGTYNSVTDAFTQVLDLNDRATYFIRPGGTTLSQPTKVYARSSNIFAAGERIAAAQYQNRHLTVALNLRATTTSGLVAAARALIQAIERPPYVLRVAFPGSTQYSYADVVAVKHNIPSDPQQILNGAIVKAEIDFEVRPGFRGDRITAQNLVVNPGFEAPSSLGVTAFTDSFANLDAYTGTGLTQDVTTYSDVVFGTSPARYMRLDETSGTTAYDAALSGQNGTYNGGYTQNHASTVPSTSDPSVLFGGGYISGVATGLATGNNPWSLTCWINISGLPASVAYLMTYGSGAKSQPSLYLNSTGTIAVDASGTAGVATGAAVSQSVNHFLAATYDGTNIKLYLDGVLQGSAAPGALTVTNANLYLAALSGGTGPFNGAMKDATFHTTALTATQITNMYNAGHNAVGAAASTLQVPSGNSATFGSPVWGPISQWQVRFRYRAGMTAYFNAHAGAGSSMGVEIGMNTLYLQQTIAGVQHILGSASFTTINEAWYWLNFTQFPTVAGVPCDVQVSLYADSNGSLGSLITSISATPTYDAVTALSGQAQFATNGAALGIGGANVSRSTHSLALFGPGGWLFFPTDSTTGAASGAWEQSTANTYGGGVVTSYGAARIDAAPAGTLGGNWETFSGGATAGSSAIPAAPAQTFGVAAWVKSSGVGASCAQTLQVLEYDTNGNYLRGNTVATHTGASGWVQLTGSYVTGASCAWIALRLEALDTTVGSVGGTVWFDNVQCWNETTTGQTSMPYCELGFAHSPAQLLITGILGDMPSPALVSVGAWISSMATGYGAIVALGRRAQASANAQMVGNSVGYYGTGVSPQSIAVLDANSYGGYYAQATVNPQWNPRAFSFAPADLLGVFHLINRFYTAEANNLSTDVETRIVTQQKTGAWYGNTSNLDQLGAYYGPYTSPIQSSAVWSVVDSGEVRVPALPAGAATDLTQNYLTPRPQWGDLNTGGSTCRSNWQCLLPVDAETLILQVINADNAPFALSNEWLWVYADGLATQRGDPTAATYSLESAPTPNPGHGGGGYGTGGTGALSVNSEASTYMMLDPLVNVAAVSGATTAAGGSGVNQFAGYAMVAPYDVAAADATGTPMRVELRYSPLYLYPR